MKMNYVNETLVILILCKSEYESLFACSYRNSFKLNIVSINEWQCDIDLAVYVMSNLLQMYQVM